MFKSMKRFLKGRSGNTLAEFAVTTAMMATLATTAAPKFSGVGEGAKEKKTLADIDKIVKSANNFYNAKVTEEGTWKDFLVKSSMTKRLVFMITKLH